MSENTAAFVVGVMVGWIALAVLIFGVLGAKNPDKVRADVAERGWFEHQGKVFRVVPAEVR